MRLEEIDLLDHSLWEPGPPHRLFERLRNESPVHWHPERDGAGFWAVTRHRDVLHVSRNAPLFSSYLGGTMIEDPQDVDLMGVRMMMLNMDPPGHTKLRALVNKGFTPRMVEALRQRIDELALAIVDRALERREFDFVADVAGELPSYVIAELMGIPLEDGRELYRLTERMHTTTPTEEARVSGRNAVADMLGYSAQLRGRKRERPGSDIASTLLAAELDGEKLSDLEFDMFFLLLINAGGDTTRNLVGGGMLALLEHPSEQARLRADPGLLASAIEEMLRFLSPVIHMRRTASADTEIGGQPIRSGDKVVLWYGSANRDPEAFVEPDRFDIGRSPNDHLAFGGGGVHYCLGANLARVEIRALFARILERMGTIERTGPVERLSSVFINGPRRMPVRATESRA
jgi:cytochrome P450